MSDPSPIPDHLRIEIIHASGTETFDPNTLIKTLLSTPEKLPSLKSSGDISLLSGTPGLTYKTNEVCVGLTAGEISRLTLQSLTPKEFFALRRACGDFYEIHDDFYDADTGEALQPKG